MYLVGFILRIYHNAWSPECLMCVCSVTYVFKMMKKVLLLTSNTLQVVTLSRNSVVQCMSQMPTLRYTTHSSMKNTAP